MNVWRAVRWWDEWQLRILVLGSLGFQWFLLVGAPMRKYTIPRWFRTCIWLAYISSDALATLFNRHAKSSNGSTCNGGGGVNGGQAGVLEILWAPVLLIHLGGQREVTAYAIEDNELWLRHTVTLVSQVAVAIYAFYKSWPNSTDRRLWASAVLLFIVGVLSFSEKPWAFYRARINRLAAVSSVIQGTRKQSKWWEWCFTELEMDVEDMIKCMCVCWRKKSAAEDVKRKKQERNYKNQVHMILSDMSLLAAATELNERRKQQQGGDTITYLPPLEAAEKFSKKWLRRAFRLIYTRANVVWTPAYLAYHLLLVPALHGAAIALFAVSHKRGRYNPTDVKTTYVLLCFTATLDIMATFIVQLLHGLMALAGVPSLCEWIAQYNLIDAVLRRTQPTTGWLIKCAAHVGLQESNFMPKRDELYNKVAGYLFLELFAPDEPIAGRDLSTYRNLGPDDSNWALGEDTEVRKSLKASFDRSVLLWHLATDLCFCYNPPPAPVVPREVRTEAISNYMAHLLNSRPDMLMTGSRRHLFTEAMEQVEHILKLRTGRHFVKHTVVENDKVLVETIFRRTLGDHGCMDVHDTATGDVTAHICDSPERSRYPVVHDACRLAQELLRMDEERRFELMYRVWLGMIFYSASVCRGYLHAKSLGEGGEFLSFVWLLISLKGTKTLADKLQMPDQVGTYDKGHELPTPKDKPMEIPDTEDWF